MHQLSRKQARQIAVQAQWLHRDRPPGLVDLVRRLTLVQVDLTTAVAPSAELVAWSRLGAAFEPDDLETALGNQAFVEYQGQIRPAEDLALFRAGMAAWDENCSMLGGWRKANRGWVEALRRDPALAKGLNTHDGKVVYGPVAEAHELEHIELRTLLG